jgi:hypothetical protein
MICGSYILSAFCKGAGFVAKPSSGIVSVEFEGI